MFRSDNKAVIDELIEKLRTLDKYGWGSWVLEANMKDVGKLLDTEHLTLPDGRKLEIVGAKDGYVHVMYNTVRENQRIEEGNKVYNAARENERNNIYDINDYRKKI